MNALRYIDVAFVVVTAPVVALLGAPALGVLLAALVWVLQRIAEVAIERVAKSRADIKGALGINLAGVMGRAWLVALSILAIGLAGEREDGLAAALLILVAFTLYFANSLLARSLDRSSAPS